MKISDISYVRPDVDGLIAKIKELTTAFRRAKSAKKQYEIILQTEKTGEEESTMFSLANIRYTLNTKDEFYKAEKDFMDEASPKIAVAENEWNKAVLASKYRAELQTMFPEVYFKNLQIEADAMDKKILSLSVKEGKTVSKYIELMSALTVRYRGETLTPSKLGKYFTNPKRSLRKGAYMAYGRVLKKNGAKLDAYYDKLVAIRTEMGRKMGYENYAPLGYLKMGRNCYNRDDVAKLHDNVQKYIVPLVSKIRKKQQETLNVDELFLYDRDVYTKKEPKLVLTVEEIFQESAKMFQSISPLTGELMQKMLDAEAFDVLPREGKWGGGYCTDLATYRLPFILANFNGSYDDIGTLTHEFGHALAANQSFSLPYLKQGSMETCEVHSMSMELFTYPYMKAFFKKQVGEYYLAHLSSAVAFLPYGTLVDHFQQEVYERPEMTKAQRNALWLSLQKTYLPEIEVKGLPAYEDGRWWQRQMHIYETPFYYIDYVIAQITALQFFALSQEDYAKAFDTYLKFVNQGGMDTYLGLLHSAGLKSPFEEETFPSIVSAVEKQLHL